MSRRGGPTAATETLDGLAICADTDGRDLVIARLQAKFCDYARTRAPRFLSTCMPRLA